LQNQQVIEEHFYINDFDTLPENDLVNCFEEFILPAGKTLNFSANLSSFVGYSPISEVASFSLILYQDEDVVALNKDSTGLNIDYVLTVNSNLIFSEKNVSGEDLPYKFCIAEEDENNKIMMRNMIQWGYKILGDGYNLIEHRFDGSALTANKTN